MKICGGRVFLYHYPLKQKGMTSDSKLNQKRKSRGGVWWACFWNKCETQNTLLDWCDGCWDHGLINIEILRLTENYNHFIIVFGKYNIDMMQRFQPSQHDSKTLSLFGISKIANERKWYPWKCCDTELLKIIIIIYCRTSGPLQYLYTPEKTSYFFFGGGGDVRGLISMKILQLESVQKEMDLKMNKIRSNLYSYP